MLFLNRCKSMIDPDSEGYLSDFSDFEELEPSGPKISKPKVQTIIRKGYIDNAVSNKYRIGFTSTVSLQNWKVGITTRKTNNNVYVYFLKIKKKKMKGKKQSKEDMFRSEINCIILTQYTNNPIVNGISISLGDYKVFEIEGSGTKWAELRNWAKEIKEKNVKVVIKLQNLDNLKEDISDAFRSLITTRQKYTINWVQP